VDVREGPGSAHDWAFLAMAHQRLGETAEARTFLDKLRAHKPPAKELAWDNLEIEVLREEAEALLKDKAPRPMK
jgi:hypothetical protein